MFDNVSLDETHWKAAHEVALALVRDDVDTNELKKATGYLRTIVSQQNAGSKFFDYLRLLVNNAEQIGHSNKTKDYHRAIEKHCNAHLRPFQAEPLILLQILGWTTRLATYYKQTGPIGELPLERVDEVLPPSKKLPSGPTVTYILNQVVEAIVIKIAGNLVTYEVAGLKRTQKEPKLASLLKEGQQVKVQIAELREDGSPKKFKI